jgi:hypothetical protein
MTIEELSEIIPSYDKAWEWWEDCVIFLRNFVKERWDRVDDLGLSAEEVEGFAGMEEQKKWWRAAYLGAITYEIMQQLVEEDQKITAEALAAWMLIAGHSPEYGVPLEDARDEKVHSELVDLANGSPNGDWDRAKEWVLETLGVTRREAAKEMVRIQSVLKGTDYELQGREALGYTVRYLLGEE